LWLFSAAVTRKGKENARTCEIIINIARHHFHNNITDKNALQQQLLRECQGLNMTEGQNASLHCRDIVNNNIDAIFADMSTNKSPRQTCIDIKECVQQARRVKRQGPPQGDCFLCNTILNIAEHHFHNHIDNKTALQRELHVECRHLGQLLESDDSYRHCLGLVDSNMDRIFDDLSRGIPPIQTCIDIHECMPFSSTTPHPPRAKRQRPHDPCRTCDIIINIARHHFHNNINDIDALQKQLQLECDALGQQEGQEAAAHCTSIVNQNMPTIFSDLQAGKSAHQTCMDIGECHQ